MKSFISKEVYNQLPDTVKNKCKEENRKLLSRGHWPQEPIHLLTKNVKWIEKHYVRYRDADGKQKVSKLFTVKKLAEKFKLQVEYDQQTNRLDSFIKNMEVSKGIEKYLEHLRLQGRRKSTILRAKQILQKLIDFCNEKEIRFLDKITIEHMEEYKSWNRNMKPYLIEKNIGVSARTLVMSL